jgi:hypothetical protein
MWHSKIGDFLGVENLLVNGVDSTICDIFGHNAIYYAQQKQCQDIVHLLQYWQVLSFCFYLIFFLFSYFI